MHKVETFDPLPHEDFADLARRFVPRQAVDGQARSRHGKPCEKCWF
jgi:hypothetical protein